jgi:2-polyprenyl-3-methyl-5-hydroxy-6-metoxy-1,4-benzoquinol methylase
MSDDSNDSRPQEEPTDQTSRFDEAAQSWDDKPGRVELATAVAAAISEAVPLQPQMQIMDFGCGTGLISRALAPRVASITAADTSTEMLMVLKTKARAAGLTRIRRFLLDAGYQTPPGAAYDAIVSSMVLHHIEDIPTLVTHLAQWCRPGGWLALADLQPEDGTFHPDAHEVFHHGIDPAELAAQLETVGFEIKSIRTVHTIQRPPAEGAEPRDYPVFLLVARRNDPGTGSER